MTESAEKNFPAYSHLPYQSSIQLLKPLYIDTAGFAFALNPKDRPAEST
ncbi:hypothetical protein JD543_20035 [Aeromonas caviae]|nr:hypothetical protein [Aeromonas caviae]MBL0439661.1 hypothetical protein [Aeromonas caviae]